jgi:AraC-like DNA-binding protein
VFGTVMMAVAAAAFAAAAVDTASAVAVPVDAAGAVAVDTSAGRSVDTPAPADTLTAVAAPLSADTSISAAASAPIDTLPPPTAAQVDEDTVKPAAGDTAAPFLYSSLFTEKVETPPSAKVTEVTETPDDAADSDSKGFPVSMSLAIFFAVSMAVIITTLIFFLRKKESKRFLTTTRLSVLDKMVQKGCRSIESNYADPDLSITTVCKELVTGEAYLNALFIKELGINVEDFITQVRVNGLKNALATGSALEQDMENTCIKCGFKDRAEAELHFARLAKMGIEEYIQNTHPR